MHLKHQCISYQDLELEGKEIQIILRLFLVIAMYCQASSSLLKQSLNLPPALTGWEGSLGTCSRQQFTRNNLCIISISLDRPQNVEIFHFTSLIFISYQSMHYAGLLQFFADQLTLSQAGKLSSPGLSDPCHICLSIILLTPSYSIVA